MEVYDISTDGKLRLVKDDAGDIHYETHDGSKVQIVDQHPGLLRQAHYVACVVRDKADQNGLVLGPVRKATPGQWTQLSVAALA